MLRTKCAKTPIQRKRDGLRILVTRVRGRGLPASRYDVWMANLGPSQRLLEAFQTGKISWAQFSKLYLAWAILGTGGGALTIPCMRASVDH